MQILTGHIKSIHKDNTVDFPKSILELSMPFGESAFIEFRGAIMTKLLAEHNIGEAVIVCVSNKGSISKRSGCHYNNLIAKTIKKMNINHTLNLE